MQLHREARLRKHLRNSIAHRAATNYCNVLHESVLKLLFCVKCMFKSLIFISIKERHTQVEHNCAYLLIQALALIFLVFVAILE